MKTWEILTIVILVIVGVALVTASALAFLGGGMMGNYGSYGTPTGTAGNYGYYGGGMMGGGYGGGMMGGGYGGTYAAQLNITTAETIATNYLSAVNNPDLAVKEIEEYSQNFYVQYYEKSTGIGAFEMLIDKYTGAITPEMGPNMMWNTKYGMMSGGGMMGGFYGGAPTATMQVSADQAKTGAQQFLNAYYPETTTGEIFAFYGYYHVMVHFNGNNYGMLSVNGYTGQVWYHNWHGTFLQEVDLS